MKELTGVLADLSTASEMAKSLQRVFNVSACKKASPTTLQSHQNIEQATSYAQFIFGNIY
jgi:hypothetical protein